MEAALVCRARQKAGYSLADYPLPYWAEKVHLLATAISAQVENEQMDEEDDTGNSKDFVITGAGDSGAFALIHQHMQEMKEKRNGR